jgi:translocator protein
MSVVNPTEQSARSSVTLLFVCLGAVLLTALFGASFKPGDWYSELVKPSWNPPNWIFGPVWTALYIMNAIAAWRIARLPEARFAFGAWLLHLVPNALWSFFFFGLHRIDWALLDITLLAFSIVTVMALFYRRDKIAAALLLPYLAWVCFAGVLNWTLFSLNLSA